MINFPVAIFIGNFICLANSYVIIHLCSVKLICLFSLSESQSNLNAFLYSEERRKRNGPIYVVSLKSSID